MLRYSVDEENVGDKEIEARFEAKNKKAANTKLIKNRIYIGDEYDRWMEIKTPLRLETNSEVAKILLLTSSSFRFTFHYFPFNPQLKIIFP